VITFDSEDLGIQARKNGAQGIGLTRTEHMFFASQQRISAVRHMILAKDHEEREKALEPIEQFQQQDFEGIFKVMDGLPVIIRLLDPPLHEFLPAHDNEVGVATLAKEISNTPEQLKEVISGMKEVNPMLGFRGCRLGVAYPEVTRCQVMLAFLSAKMQRVRSWYSCI
jgi:pyruvate,orthophosphate dikinase